MKVVSVNIQSSQHRFAKSLLPLLCVPGLLTKDHPAGVHSYLGALCCVPHICLYASAVLL